MKLAFHRAMTRSVNARTVVLVLAVLHGSALRAQDTDSTAAPARSASQPAVHSIGQPPLWRAQVSAQGSIVTQGGRSSTTFSYGVFHAFSKPPIAAFNPVLGLIGGTVEAYRSI